MTAIPTGTFFCGMNSHTAIDPHRFISRFFETSMRLMSSLICIGKTRETGFREVENRNSRTRITMMCHLCMKNINKHRNHQSSGSPIRLYDCANLWIYRQKSLFRVYADEFASGTGTDEASGCTDCAVFFTVNDAFCERSVVNPTGMMDSPIAIHGKNHFYDGRGIVHPATERGHSHVQ